jgi:hypothetical protein
VLMGRTATPVGGQARVSITAANCARCWSSRRGIAPIAAKEPRTIAQGRLQVDLREPSAQIAPEDADDLESARDQQNDVARLVVV